jgi:DNA polymerase I-like protein with 3'-5' exonuclease and polymerase domains
MKADYSQVELRIGAWVANEERMLRAFRAGEDLHKLTAKLVLNDESTDARQVGKTLNFGLLYGAGPGTLRRIARVDYDVHLTDAQAKQYHAAFFDAYPAIRKWHRIMRKKVSATATSTSAFGRIRHLEDARSGDDSKKYSAILEGTNHPVQSFAHDLLLRALTKVHEAIDPSVQIVAEVHDEIDLLVPDELVTETGSLVKDIMEDLSWLGDWGIKLPVPIVAEIETGTHWGSLS